MNRWVYSPRFYTENYGYTQKLGMYPGSFGLGLHKCLPFTLS